MAICDSNYKFLLVDIGDNGRHSDGGVFSVSKMGKKFARHKMNLPVPRKIMADGNLLPYILVGDEAFHQCEYLLRPYSKATLDNERRIFNYRLSRARRTIENVFGIIVSRFRILKKPMECSVDNAIAIVQAIVVLHNYLIINDEMYLPETVDPIELRREIENSVLRDTRLYGNHNSSRYADKIKEEFCSYFNNEGAVEWQYDITDLQ